MLAVQEAMAGAQTSMANDVLAARPGSTTKLPKVTDDFFVQHSRLHGLPDMLALLDRHRGPLELFGTPATRVGLLAFHQHALEHGNPAGQLLITAPGRAVGAAVDSAGETGKLKR